MKHWVSRDEVSYQYDELGRLIAAATTGPQWGQSWTYDGFGNRLAQNVTKGTAPVVSLSISAATNRITTSGFAYNAAGQMSQWPGGTVTLGAEYDVDGRLSVVKEDGTAKYNYAYDARNRRVRRKDVSGNPPHYEVYGPGGELLGMYGGYWYMSGGQWQYVFRVEEERIYFAGRVVARLDESGSAIEQRMDRLGSVKAWQRYPFGEGNESDTNDQYATYPIDRRTGHYYAWNRFYSTTWGRFSSPDPFQNGVQLTKPQSWNAYSYVRSDPVNAIDPTGLAALTNEYCHWFGQTDWECWNDNTRFAEASPAPGKGGGWDPCPSGPGFLPNPMCSVAVVPILPVLPPKTEEPELPVCEIQVKYRPVRVPGLSAVHVYLWINDGMNQLIAEGKPEYLNPKTIVNVVLMPGGGLVPVVTLTWGMLQGTVSKGSGLRDNDPDNDPRHGPPLRGPFWCGAVIAIKTASGTYNTRQVQYWPTGPNSNSYAHWLLMRAGLASVFRAAPPGAVGWDTPLWP